MVAVLGAAQIALRSLSRAQIEQLAERAGGRAGARLRRIAADTDAHADAIGFLRIFATLVVVIAIVRWVGYLRGLGADGHLAWTELFIGLPLAAVMLWIFAQAPASSLARHAGGRVLVAMSRPLRIMQVIASPVRGGVGVLDEIVRRLAGPQLGAESGETELLSAVEEGEREGHIDPTERDMIEGVVELREKTVEQIMTPRTEMQTLEYTDDLDKVKEFMRDCTHSRVPVSRESLDRIVGILYAKDLLKWLAEPEGESRPFDLQSILRPATFVPETKTVRELMVEMLAQRVHIAMAADEYGGTAGLVTVEDIVEEIFGEIHDEYEPLTADEPAVAVDIEAATAEADARAYVHDVNDAIEPLGLKIPEDEDYDTLGGFIVTTLGRIPEVGDTLRSDGALITVTAAEPTRVLRARIEVAPAEARQEPAAARESGRDVGK
jgi:putative hemolysin